MPRIIRHLPSPAMAVALIALLVALGGVAVASIPGPGRVIKACYSKSTGTLRAIDSKKRCSRKVERTLSWNQQGPRGLQGVQGSKGVQGNKGDAGTTGNKGDAGTAVAYARVAADGTPEPGDNGKQNKVVVAGNIEHDVTTGAGHYCFGGLPFGVASAMVSPDSAGDIDGNVGASVAVQRGKTLGNCDAQHQQARVTALVAGAAADHRFQIWFESTGGPQIAAGVGGD
jgi:hypothetical protein